MFLNLLYARNYNKGLFLVYCTEFKLILTVISLLTVIYGSGSGVGGLGKDYGLGLGLGSLGSLGSGLGSGSGLC